MSPNERHRLLSAQTSRKKEELEAAYAEHGYKVRVDVFITFLMLATVAFSGCVCFPNESPNPSSTPGNRTATATSSTTGTTCKGVPYPVYQNVTVKEACLFKQVEILTINQTMNVSGSQRRAIENMRPKSCYTTGCSHGYFMAKYEVMDTMLWKRPQYTEEAPRSRFDAKNATYLEVGNDGFTDYLLFNSSFWYIVPDRRDIMVRRLNGTRTVNYTYEERDMKYGNFTTGFDLSRKMMMEGWEMPTAFSWVEVEDFISGKTSDPFVMETRKARDNSVMLLMEAPMAQEILDSPEFTLIDDLQIRKLNGSWVLWLRNESATYWKADSLPELLGEAWVKIKVEAKHEKLE